MGQLSFSLWILTSGLAAQLGSMKHTGRILLEDGEPCSEISDVLNVLVGYCLHQKLF